MNFRFLNVTRVVFSVLLTAVFPVWAAAQASLPDVVVTASLSEQVVRDAIPFSTVLGRDVIEQSQAIDLPSLLRHEAGFQFTQNGGPGQTSTLFLRGSASMQVLVLIDGVAMTKQDASGAVSLEHIMLDQVDHVEIVHGNVSAIYGSGAIGGVIQIFTRQGSHQPSASAKLELGSRGSVRASTAIAGQSGDTMYSFGASHFQTNGISAMNTVQYPNENPDADGYRNSSYSLSLRQAWAPGQSIGFKAEGFNGQFETDGGGFGAATEIYKGASQRNNWTLDSRNQWSSDWRSELSLRNGREHSVYNALQTSFPYQSAHVTNTNTLNWTNFLTRGNWLWTAGFEAQHQSLDASDNTPSQLAKSREVLAAFGGLTAVQGKHSWQLNLRQDHVDDLGDKATGYAGYGYQFTTQWKWLASASTAFNWPPLGYVYDPWFGNPDLKPETAHSVETGLQWISEKTMVRGTVFQTRTRDLLQYDFSTSTFANISRSHNEGFELTASGPLTSGNWRASVTRQHPLDESTGQQLARRARSMASLGVHMPWAGWGWGANLNYTGARPDIGSHPEMKAYALVNISAHKALSRGLELTARIDNMTNRQYQTAYGYKQPGRMVHVGLKWQQR